MILVSILCGITEMTAQEFFNLTAEQVKIDTLLPRFSYSRYIGKCYSDSIYNVTIEYPEFVDMTETDILRYKSITSDTLPELPEVSVGVSVSRKQGSLDVSFVPLVFRDGRYKKLVSFKLAVTARAAGRAGRMARATKEDAAARYADHSVLRSGSWAKIRIPRSGVYRITDELVAKAGFKDPSRVKVYGYGGALQPEGLTGDYLKASDDLRQVPLCNVNGRRLFYATGPVTWKNDNTRERNPYSDYGYYFLTDNDEEPLTVDSAAFVSGFYPSADFQNTLYEKDDYAWLHSGRNLYDSQLYAKGTPNDYILQSGGASAAGTLRVVLTANSTSSASLATVSVNDSVVGTVTVPKISGDYIYATAAGALFNVRNLKASNKITITQTSGGTMRLDHIIVHCDAPAEPPRLSTGVFDVPEYVYRITNQDHHSDAPVDMVIIIPTSQKLSGQAERLKRLHETEGMSVRIVPADELFNEFSSGTPDATAYRRYMKMLYDRAATEDEMPKYLVLFGDGAWDNRMNTSDWRSCSPDDFLLCFESEESFNNTMSFVSDDFYCMLDDGELIGTGRVFTGKPDVAVGRFPVRTLEEARIMVDKIIAYTANGNAGEWQNKVVFLADDGNNNIHMTGADDAAKMVEERFPAFDVKRVMWDAYTRVTSSTGNSFPEVEKIVRQYMSSGALLMNYTGHGAAYCLSHEMAIKISDFKNAVSARLPLWFTAACDVMPFDRQEDNIGETAVLNRNGGAIAFFGTARTVYTHYNDLMNIAFTREVLTPGVSVGEAARRAKNYLVSPIGQNGGTDKTENKLHYILLGDPALKLAVPPLALTIDSINGHKADGSSFMELKAGESVKVSGHIGEAGSTVDDFNGVVTASVSDVKELITCKLNNTNMANNEGATTAFTYYDRPSTLFRGTDSVRNGRFTFHFVVPKDISYSEGSGRMVAYAVSDGKDRTANGYCESFNMGGSSSLRRDSIGPSVYCYLNSPSFTNGGSVNATPYFFAELYDEDGINSAGTGIGHDIELIIDGDMSKTYVLNDYFTYDFGSYTNGAVGFSIPRLGEGSHKLLFRAWDILNNPATAELTFNVVGALEPNLLSVDCTRNPATTSTSFRIVHDRAGCSIDVVVDVFDMSGRHLWSHSETGVSSGNTLDIDWDLTVDGGRRLGTGVYLYRVRLGCEGSSYASKAKKLIVLSNK